MRGLWIADCELRIVDCEFRISNCGFRIARSCYLLLADSSDDLYNVI